MQHVCTWTYPRHSREVSKTFSEFPSNFRGRHWNTPGHVRDIFNTFPGSFPDKFSGQLSGRFFMEAPRKTFLKDSRKPSIARLQESYFGNKKEIEHMTQEKARYLLFKVMPLLRHPFLGVSNNRVGLVGLKSEMV